MRIIYIPEFIIIKYLIIVYEIEKNHHLIFDFIYISSIQLLLFYYILIDINKS
jgi:hypothetical protein